MSTRRRAREIALQMLYQLEASGEQPTSVVALYKQSFADGSSPDQFAIDLFVSVADHLTQIDDLISRSSENWRLDRMSRVDRNILRIGAWEITSGGEIPARVAINESVELAKRFGTADSAAFVNGILDRIARDIDAL